MNQLSGSLHAFRNRIESFAQKPYALGALFLIAFIESSLFPVPPDILLVALGISNPRRSFLYAGVCIAGSVSGAFLGYYVGYALFETVGSSILEFSGVSAEFQIVLDKFRQNAWLTLLVAGFTPVPFMVFTIAAGFKQTLDPVTLGLATLVGRTVRFFLVGAFLYFFGATMKEYIGRSLERVTLVLGVLFVAGIILFKWVF